MQVELLHSIMRERFFDDPDFWFSSEGATSKAECKHCGLKMYAIEADEHREECPTRPPDPERSRVAE